MGKVLELLKDEQVLDIGLTQMKDVCVIEECCDNYYNVYLTKTNLAALITELQDIHDQMIEPEEE